MKEEKMKEKEKGLLGRLFSRRRKKGGVELKESEEKLSVESCGELETKVSPKSKEGWNDVPSPSSENKGIEGAAASILSKYFTCRVYNTNKIILFCKRGE